MKQRLMKLTLIAGVAAIGLAAMPAESFAFGDLFGCGHRCRRTCCYRPCCPPPRPCCYRPCCPPPCYRPCAPACCGPVYYRAAPAAGCCAVPRWSAPTYAVTPVAPQPIGVVHYGHAPVLRGF